MSKRWPLISAFAWSILGTAAIFLVIGIHVGQRGADRWWQAKEARQTAAGGAIYPKWDGTYFESVPLADVPSGACPRIVDNHIAWSKTFCNPATAEPKKEALEDKPSADWIPYGSEWCWGVGGVTMNGCWQGPRPLHCKALKGGSVTECDEFVDVPRHERRLP